MDSSEYDRKYERISPTAWGPAWKRSLTDIPYALEVFLEFDSFRNSERQEIAKAYDMKEGIENTPFFEARHLILNKIIKEIEPSQIIELASGLTPRGLEAVVNSEVMFIEMDLASIINDKKYIVHKISSGANIQGELICHSGNILEKESLLQALSYFDFKKEITFITEGLLYYLNKKEQILLSRLIREALLVTGGIWITPDITFKEGYPGLGSGSRYANLTDSGDFEENVFLDEDDAQNFFEQLGFQVERRRYEEVADELVSPERLMLDQKTVREQMNWMRVFVMKPFVS